MFVGVGVWYLVFDVWSNFFEKYAKSLKSPDLAYVLRGWRLLLPLSEPPGVAKRMLKVLNLRF